MLRSLTSYSELPVFASSDPNYHPFLSEQTGTDSLSFYNCSITLWFPEINELWFYSDGIPVVAHPNDVWILGRVGKNDWVIVAPKEANPDEVNCTPHINFSLSLHP